MLLDAALEAVRLLLLAQPCSGSKEESGVCAGCVTPDGVGIKGTTLAPPLPSTVVEALPAVSAEGGSRVDCCGLPQWLIAAAAGQLAIGDSVPAEWRVGVHYTIGGGGGGGSGICLSEPLVAGDTVIAKRSDGRWTFASLTAVKDAGAGSIALELLVGPGLQKSTTSERVGRLHPALASFLTQRCPGLLAGAGGVGKDQESRSGHGVGKDQGSGVCAPTVRPHPAAAVSKGWSEGLEVGLVESLLQLDAASQRA